MSLFISSTLATALPVFRDTGSPCVAVRLLARTFPERDAVGHSLRADGCSKTFPDVRHEFGVASCKQESRLVKPL